MQRSSASTRSCCSAYSRCLARRSSCSLDAPAADRASARPRSARQTRRRSSSASRRRCWRRRHVGLERAAPSPRPPRRGGSARSRRTPRRGARGVRPAGRPRLPAAPLGCPAVLAARRLASLCHHDDRQGTVRAGRRRALGRGPAPLGARRACASREPSRQRAVPASTASRDADGAACAARAALAAGTTLRRARRRSRGACSRCRSCCSMLPAVAARYAGARPSATAATTAR